MYYIKLLTKGDEPLQEPLPSHREQASLELTRLTESSIATLVSLELTRLTESSIATLVKLSDVAGSDSNWDHLIAMFFSSMFAFFCLRIATGSRLLLAGDVVL